jgi:hypothetical protein
MRESLDARSDIYQLFLANFRGLTNDLVMNDRSI